MTFKQAVKLFVKEIQVHIGRGRGVSAAVFFPAAVTFAVSYITKSGVTQFYDILIIWTIVYLSSLTICGYTFNHDIDNGHLYILKLSFRPSEIFISKLLFNFFSVTAVFITVFLTYFFFNGLSLTENIHTLPVYISGIVSLGSVLSSLGIINAVSGGRNPLFGILSVPILLPISGVFITSAATGQNQVSTVFFLLSFSVFICAVSFVVFEKVWEKSG